MADDINLYGLALMNEVAEVARRRILHETPYRTGKLAEGISDIGKVANGAGFDLLTPQTQYGATLNEYPIIHYKIANPKTGRTYEGSYANKHYQWVARAAEQVANDIPVNFPNIKRIL